MGSILAVALLLGAWSPDARADEVFRVATYNVENYLDQPTESRRHIKSAEGKAKIRESIRALNPDVLALEEMGGTNALLELRATLRAEGVDFPFWDHLSGVDTNIHVAVLSRFPIVARRPHTNDQFLLGGRRFGVGRGFSELEIQVGPGASFTLLAAHLKSRRPVPEADEAELRLQEARALRGIIDAHFRADPESRLIVLGDFNDVKNSPPLKTIVGRGKFKLGDARPAERNGDTAPHPNPHQDPRTVTWTYHYGQEDTYTRIDYILMSPSMARDWVTNSTYVLTLPDWGTGSDHRPILATFNKTPTSSRPFSSPGRQRQK